MSSFRRIWGLASSFIRLAYQKAFEHVRIPTWFASLLRFGTSQGRIKAIPEYAPTNAAKNQIRPLRIIPTSDHSTFFGRETLPSERNLVVSYLETVSLDDKPEYVALSYAWGNYTPRMAVYVDNRPVETTFSLEGALQVLQKETETVNVWADALCINQTDNLEKQHQVQLITKMYESATSVFVWLGYPMNPGERFWEHNFLEATKFASKMEFTSHKAIDYLNDLGSTASDIGILEYNISDFNNVLSGNVREDLRSLEDSLDELHTATRFAIPWHDIHFLFNYGYFSRTWVAQEIAVAKKNAIFFHCGAKKLSLQHLQASLCFFDYVRMHFALTQQLQDFLDPETSHYWTAMNEFNHKGPTRFLRARRMHQKETRRKRQDLYQVLMDMHVDRYAYEHMRLQASDPRGRIFAFLGMVTSNLGLVPDYDSYCADAYTLAAAAMLKEGHLDLLASNQSPEARIISYDKSELPSWAPNWDSRIYRPCGGFTKDGCYQASRLKKPRIDFRNLPTGSTSFAGRVRRNKSKYQLLFNVVFCLDSSHCVYYSILTKTLPQASATS